MARTWLLGCIAALVLGCGHHSSGDSDANGTGDDADPFAGQPDAFEAVIDAPPFSGSCTVGGSTQCADCVDNDSDTKIDGFDPECTSPQDDDESSFATGIPGDNIDATWQDCFYDGDSGGGNDGCNQHTCCLLQAANVAACKTLAPNSNYSKYDPTKCYQPFGTVPVPSKCSMNCGKLAPAGCDCFGCCTVCNGSTCRDIATSPAISPNCDQNNISDPGADGTLNTADDPCLACVKNSMCGGSTTCAYDTATCAANNACCTPCPGQCDANGTCNPPLPSSCGGGGTTSCPTGYTACAADGTCPAGTYCSSGCCIGGFL